MTAIISMAEALISMNGRNIAARNGTISNRAHKVFIAGDSFLPSISTMILPTQVFCLLSLATGRSFFIHYPRAGDFRDRWSPVFAIFYGEELIKYVAEDR
jgi:hypothetical protein